jgi:3-hydroxyisobutyrate dehydrogenase-like beta-hydroxyacid dehydrogenase
MGSAIGRSLAACGHRVLVSVEGRSDRTRALAAGAGLEPVASVDEVAAGAEVVLSVVPPGSARDVLAGVVASGARPLFADLNAVSPDTVRELERTAEAAGIDLVDGSISGPPPRADGSTRLYLSGPRAGEVAALEPQGMRPVVLGDRAGAASGLKMCTASVYKGTALLLTHACRTALDEGVLDEALADLRLSAPCLVEDPERWIATAASKAERYVAEMREIAATQSAAGLPAELFEAIADCYASVAETPLAAATPEQADAADDLVAVLEGLRR